jgi:hypothetical protein
MSQAMEQMLIAAEGRQLKPNEIEQWKAFVSGWPDRLSTYRKLRQVEPTLIQETLAELQHNDTTLSPQILGLCHRDLALVMRYAALAMLLIDPSLLKERAVEWMEDQVRFYTLQSTYEIAYRCLQQNLKKHLTPGELEHIRPYITEAQVALIF